MEKNVKKYVVLQFLGLNLTPNVVVATDNLEVAKMRLQCELLEHPDKADNYAIAAVDTNGELIR